ncbi:hypothetical protein SAMN02982929_04295 [Saccharopolyspora kobensis]|uniref:Uncharacterized protein n=1 Tax=Saccharopolyspora kobensis TaxID=146035 RepID=A0A1H6DEA3_9PSEU|nr:hypothetical protein [Saccharopolyspora kobensis]SEG83619.1 hypothetical protein SAMN02982929_04295 [Saccharopolyspora kobensis]SFE32553.1 hypothetical protein SAMN05216506_110212 [Saccharopolyspora kobensis]
MDASTLAAAVVQMMSALASGQPVQEGAQRVYDLVRERVLNSDVGQSAWNQFEQSPTEPAGQALLQSVVRDAISSDPEFARQLQESASSYTPTQGSSSAVGGNQENVTITNVSGIRGRNHISIGPMTINNNRQTRLSLVGAALLLLLLLGFGTYGAVTLVIGRNDSPPPESRNSGQQSAAPEPTIPKVHGLVSGRPMKSPSPVDAVFDVYNLLRSEKPEMICLLFADTGKEAFAAAHGAPDCQAAAQQLRNQVTDQNAYANPRLDRDAVVIAGNDAVAYSCRMRVEGGPVLGSFGFFRDSNGGWEIDSYELKPPTCA